MVRTKEQWQQYVEGHINMSQGLQVRGYVAGDDIKNFVDNGIFLVNRVMQDTGLTTLDGLSILDIGCANGRFPIAMDAMAYEPHIYMGIDVVKNAIDFCNRAFMEHKGICRYFFEHVNVFNARYALQQTGEAKNVDFPGGKYDLIVANSVWTHLGHPDNARYYLHKVADALSDTGVSYITWFKSPPNIVNYNEKRTVYQEGVILKMYKDAGLDIFAEYSGDSTSNQDQWRLIAQRK